MKTLGIIGGMSWESTQTYYRELNEGVKSVLGGLHSARIILFSVDFAEIELLQQQNNWDKAGQIMASAATALERAGADAIMIATNTMHKLVPNIEAVCSLPIIHIADATGRELKRINITKVALLGTRFTMEETFYRQRLTDNFDVEVLIPDAAARDTVHRIIYDELCCGQINPDSKQAYLDIIEALRAQGAQGVILGCTEIGLLIGQDDTSLPVFDTTLLHASAGVRFCIEESDLSYSC